MRFALSLILLLFSTASYSAGVKIIRGVTEKKPAPQLIDIIHETPAPPKPEPEEKVKTEDIILPIVKHCLRIEASITEHFRLTRIFNEPLQNDIMLPDFGFIFGTEWNTTTRIPRTKFNTLMLLTLSENLGFKYGSLKFHGNCKAEMIGEIEQRDNFSYAKIKMPLAFDTNEAKLVYTLEKQDGYNWVISNLAINGESISSYKNGNVESTINSLCKASSFGTLECTNPLGLNQ